MTLLMTLHRTNMMCIMRYNVHHLSQRIEDQLRNDCNNFSLDGGIPRKMDGTTHFARSDIKCIAHFFRGIPPSTEILLLLFLII